MCVYQVSHVELRYMNSTDDNNWITLQLLCNKIKQIQLFESKVY